MTARGLTCDAARRWADQSIPSLLRARLRGQPLPFLDRQRQPLADRNISAVRAVRSIYFTQGVSEPTEGLMVQPTRWLLKSWGESNEQITSFAAWITLPWLLKPLYGLLADFLPLGRNRRKNCLIVTTAAATLGYLGLYYYPPGPHAERWLFWALFVPTVAVAFTDAVVNALMIAVGQPRGITGHLQSVQWTAIWAATILDGEVGGLLSNKLAMRGAFSCAPPRWAPRW